MLLSDEIYHFHMPQRDADQKEERQVYNRLLLDTAVTWGDQAILWQPCSRTAVTQVPLHRPQQDTLRLLAASRADSGGHAAGNS